MKTIASRSLTLAAAAALALLGNSLQAQTGTDGNGAPIENNSPGAAATDASTNSVPPPTTPATAPAAPATRTTTSSMSSTTTTRSTAAASWTVYLGKDYAKTPASLTVRTNGKVYDQDNKLVGHLTDLSGNSLKTAAPAGDFNVQTRMGKVVASSRAGADVDSSRSVRLTPGS